MNGYRKYMIDMGGNLGWCKPYWSKGGAVAIAVNEGEVVGAVIDGKDIPAKDLDSADTVRRIARLVNPYYDDYSGWDDMHIAVEVMREGNCCDCPWFGICDAMDNPDGWDETPAAAEYPED